MTEKRLEFGVLGPLRVCIDGLPISLGTPKQRALLAMLIINRNRPAGLRDTSGRSHPLPGAATRIGRFPDNDIVLEDANVSRHHAVIIDTGTRFVITDLRSANGVEVEDQRIRGTAALADGNRIRICCHEFTFEIQGCEADDADAADADAGSRQSDPASPT